MLDTVLQYLAWRILTERNHTIKISFMIAGHTKFAPARFFNWLTEKLYLYCLSCNDTFPHAKIQYHWFYGYLYASSKEDEEHDKNVESTF